MTQSSQSVSPQHTTFKAFRFGGRDCRREQKGRGPGTGGGHSSTHPSDFPVCLTTLLPQTTSLNPFLKPKDKNAATIFSEKEGNKTKQNHKQLLQIKHEMKRKARLKANTNIANVLSKNSGRGGWGEVGRGPRAAEGRREGDKRTGQTNVRGSFEKNNTPAPSQQHTGRLISNQPCRETRGQFWQ